MGQRSLTDYELTGQIGSGTVGTIHRAVEKDTGKTVALKILNEAVSRDKLVRDRFYREVQVLQRLRHPNIITYFEDGRDGDALFYTMEMVTGASLKSAIASRGKLTWQVAAECGWQLCSALQHAHNHNVIHRDLKPSNLFLSDAGVLKLADFGIALDVGGVDITDQGMTVGSWLYMSPEQIRGDRGLSDQTDLYALGCVLFEMLTGEPPYPGTNFAQIFNQHLEADVPFVRQRCQDCPPKLEMLIVELLDKVADKRPGSAREVQGRLAEILIDNGASDVVTALRRAHESGTTSVRQLARTGNLGRIATNGIGRRLAVAGVAIATIALVVALLKKLA